MSDSDDVVIISLVSRCAEAIAPSRISAVRVRDGALALILDISGLADSSAEALEAKLHTALSEEISKAKANGDSPLSEISEIKILQTRERVSRHNASDSSQAPETRKSPPSQAVAKPLLIAIGSGKGGVGKSTLSANLAVALHRRGRKVGLVDADIAGPSLPRLMNSENVRPEANKAQLIPTKNRWGVPILSTGQIVPQGKAVAWRGPMVSKALGQLIEGAWSDDTEILLIDLPPGTGDIQLTMIQRHKPIGAIIVSTPQDLALIDAKRAIDLFQSTQIPILGLVENMAGFECPHCGEISAPFGHGGAEQAATAMGLAFLGRVPLDIDLRSASDSGAPPAAADSPLADCFANIAAQVEQQLETHISH